MIDQRRKSFKPRAVAAVIMALIIVCVGVYTTQFGQGVFSGIASVLPFPAMKVNGDFEFYGGVMERYRGLERFYEANGGGVSDSAELRRRLFESLTREKLIRQIMNERQIFLSKESVSVAMQDMQGQTVSREDFENQVKENYGWSLKEFEKYVVEPFVEAKTLEEALLSDRDLQAEKKTLVNEIYDKIKNGAHFDGMVLEYSEDATKIFNGDFGWMTEDEMPEEWRGPALHLDIGGISPVLEERDRFTILRVDDRETLEVEEYDVESASESEKRVNFSAIIINKVSLADVIDDFRKSSKIKIFVEL